MLKIREIERVNVSQFIIEQKGSRPSSIPNFKLLGTFRSEIGFLKYIFDILDLREKVFTFFIFNIISHYHLTSPFILAR